MRADAVHGAMRSWRSERVPADSGSLEHDALAALEPLFVELFSPSPKVTRSGPRERGTGGEATPFVLSRIPLLASSLRRTG